MMIENDILTIIYHEGKGRFTINLSLFLPCSNTDLKRIINMIDESPDRDETARELSDYIAAKQAETEAEAANEWRDNAKKKLKAAAGKYAALSAIMSKHYGTQATEAPHDVKAPEKTAQAPETVKRTESTEATETSTETAENAAEKPGSPQANNTTPGTITATETAETSATEESPETPTEHTETEAATEAPKTPTKTQQTTETGEDTLNTAAPTERAKTAHRDGRLPKAATAPERGTGPGTIAGRRGRRPNRSGRSSAPCRFSPAPPGGRFQIPRKIFSAAASAVSEIVFPLAKITLANLTLAKMEG